MKVTVVMYYLLVVTTSTPCHFNLLKYLFHPNRYDLDLHPFNYSHPLDVVMAAKLYQVLELNEKREELQMNMWFIFSWTDPYLIWEPAEFCNITETTVHFNRVWTPEIILYNSENLGMDLFPKTLVRVYSDGHVSWPTTAFLQTACSLDMKNYPFDLQTCSLTFGSWSENGNKLMLLNSSSEVGLTDYIGNGEWELLQASMSHEIPYFDSPDPWPQVVLKFRFKRRSMWYLFNLVLPCVLLMIVGVFGFFLSAETGEKIGLSTTLLLTMMLLQLMVAETQPVSSDVIPILTQFFSMSISMLVLSTAAAILVMVMYQMGDRGHRVSHTLRTIIRYLALPLCMHTRINQVLPKKPKSNQCEPLECIDDHRPVTDGFQITGVQGQPDMSQVTKMEMSEKKQSCDVYLETVCGLQKQAVRAEFNEQLVHMMQQFSSVYLAQQKDEDHRNQIKAEWQAVADVTDRLLVIIFTVIVVGACIGIFMQATNQ